MKLSDYMAERGIDNVAMADRIGRCSESAVRKWKYGERVPRPSNLRRIVEVTEGLVEPADFWPSEADAADMQP